MTAKWIGDTVVIGVGVIVFTALAVALSPLLVPAFLIGLAYRAITRE